SEVAGQGSDGVDLGRLLGVGAAVVAVFAGQQVVTPILRALAQALGRRVDLQLQARVMEATLTPAGIAHLDDPAMAECVWEARAVGTGEITARDALLALATLLSRALAGLGLAAVLLTYRWWMAFLMVGLYLALGRCLMADLRRYVEASGRTGIRRPGSPAERDLLIGIAARRELSSLLQRVRDRVTIRTDVRSHPPPQAGRSRYRAWWDRTWLPMAATTGIALTQGVIFALLVRSAAAGQITLAQLTTYALASYALSGIVRVDAEDLCVRSGTAPVPVVAELESAVSAYRFGLAGSRPADRLPRAGIRLEGVSFGYTWRRQLVLHDVNLDIPAGRSLAIVGEKNAGKSTLVNLLARIYDPSGGRITVDGIDLANLEPGSWQDRVAVVFQDFTCYPLSLLE
ncbi:MAG: ATP-binding cassette domain-containing protein, partial [Pseudonocardiaceae bacterium]